MSNSFTGTMSIPVGEFLDGIGTVTHIAYTDGEYSSISLVISDLEYLGIDNIRDGISDGSGGSAPVASYISLAAAGMHFTFIMQASDSADVKTELTLFGEVEAAVPGSVIAIEGPNEINNFPVTFNGTTGLAGALDMQAAIYAGVAADPGLAGVAVDYFTGYNAVNIPVGPDPLTVPGLANYDNQHPYPAFDQPPAAWVARADALTNTTNPAEPAVYTETGYSSNASNEDLQAVYTSDLLFDTAKDGIYKTYLYDLLDAYAPGSKQGNDGFGLFAYSKAPKPAAVDIHNLTTILRADAGGATIGGSGTLAYALTGLPADGNSLLLQEPDGDFMLAIWAEPEIWNSTTSSEIASPSVSVTLTLENSVGTAKVFDPTIGTAAIAHYSNVSQLSLLISDHPELIELEPNAPCFVRGTHILTPMGDVLVEALKPGDTVITQRGEDAEIIWIGHRTINLKAHPEPAQARPIRIAAHAFGPGEPARDLLVSPDHALFLEGVLIPAKALIDQRAVRQLRVASVTYYHIELAEHAVIFAEHLAAESYLDTGNRHAFENGGVITLYPDFGQMMREQQSCAPFVDSGPLVNRARARLARAKARKRSLF